MEEIKDQITLIGTDRLAEIMGVTTATVNNWKSGRIIPKTGIRAHINLIYNEIKQPKQ
jgi:DNA-binding transcriptional regulator YiaG